MCALLRRSRAGVETSWNGDIETRIQIPPFEWRKGKQRQEMARQPTLMRDASS